MKGSCDDSDHHIVEEMNDKHVWLLENRERVLEWVKQREKDVISGTDTGTFDTDDIQTVVAWFYQATQEMDALSEDIDDYDAEGMLKYLSEAALRVRHSVYGKRVFFRGLIEFTNYCKNDCYYCGISHSQGAVNRYRLTKEQILECCRAGEQLGYHSYVLQGGEDPYFNDDRMCDIIRSIRDTFPESAITLSIGEKSEASYRRFFESGADRYLLRHESASDEHYAKLHPESMSLAARKECLYILRDIGYQVGAGFMVGTPFQTVETLTEDLLFLSDLKPHMVGIGPFIPSAGTRFAGCPRGSVRMTLMMLALTRLLLPKALMPSTTALGTADSSGREKGFSFGANVVMPNLSPMDVRADYALYDDKICVSDDAEACQQCLNGRILRSGNQPDYDRGDHIDFTRPQL